MIAQTELSNSGGDIPIGTFKAGLVIGLNAAQVDGDDLAGYNKLGIMGGGVVSYRVSDIWMPSVGIFFSQKGSRSDILSNPNGFPETHYQLNYIEVPLMLNYIDGGIRISGGFSYGRLLNLDIVVNDVDETSEREAYYRNNDFSGVLGFGYFINKHWGFDLRWATSLVSIVDTNVGNVINERQVNKYISFRAIYQF